MADAARPRTGLPLRIRLTLWYTVSLALILLLLGSFVYWQLRRSLLSQIDIGLQVVATQSLLNIRAENDRLSFQSIDADLARRLQDDFVVINLIGPDGALWDRLGEDDDVRPSPGSSVAAFWNLTTSTEEWRVYDRPVVVDGVTGRVQVIQDLETISLTMRNVLRQMLLAAPLALLVAALGGFWLASQALAPVHRMTQTARAITANDLRRRIDYEGPMDEVGRLAVTIDDMLNRLESGFERERRFTADAAHELRTPLTALKGRIGVTLSAPRPPSAYVETLQDMEEQVDRLARLSNDLLLMGRLQQDRFPITMERIELSNFLPAVLDMVRSSADAKEIRLTLAIAADVVVYGQFDLLTRLFLNLLDNAVRYTPPKGGVTIEGGRRGGIVAIDVSDTGPGIAAKHLPHLFERFYRIEDDRSRPRPENGQNGSGLGLALAREIARLHGGDVFVRSEQGVGTTFTVQFPLGRAEDGAS